MNHLILYPSISKLTEREMHYCLLQHGYDKLSLTFFCEKITPTDLAYSNPRLLSACYSISESTARKLLEQLSCFSNRGLTHSRSFEAVM